MQVSTLGVPWVPVSLNLTCCLVATPLRMLRSFTQARRQVCITHGACHVMAEQPAQPLAGCEGFKRSVEEGEEEERRAKLLMSP
eukprot:scaffold175194_cov15-Tisochrysis_lutea.AAC.1